MSRSMWSAGPAIVGCEYTSADQLEWAPASARVQRTSSARGNVSLSGHRHDRPQLMRKSWGGRTKGDLPV
jgi:hypothetical protein